MPKTTAEQIRRMPTAYEMSLIKFVVDECDSLAMLLRGLMVLESTADSYEPRSVAILRETAEKMASYEESLLQETV